MARTPSSYEVFLFALLFPGPSVVPSVFVCVSVASLIVSSFTHSSGSLQPVSSLHESMHDT